MSEHNSIKNNTVVEWLSIKSGIRTALVRCGCCNDFGLRSSQSNSASAPLPRTNYSRLARTLCP